MNPYKPTDDFIAEIMYKKPFANHPSPIQTIQSSYFGDLPSLVGQIVSKISSSTPTFANVLSSIIFPSPTDQPVIGTSAEIFYNTNSKGSVFGLAFAVEVQNIEVILNAMSTRIVQDNVPGLLSMRFVKGTEATLGFTKFPKTVIVEVDGVKWNGLDQFIQLMTGIVQGSGLDFAMHWGKNAAWSSTLVNKMYGSQKVKWITQRNNLISSRMRPVFAGKFLDQIGLS
jgi:hypothetical protein